MVRVYDIFQDSDQLRYLRSTWETAAVLGIATGEMVGSESWIHKIQSGRGQTYTIKGIITAVFRGAPPADDWPQIRILAEDGQESVWVRKYIPPFGDPRSGIVFDEAYQVGRSITVTYVILTWPGIPSAQPAPQTAVPIYIDISAEPEDGPANHSYT